VVLHEDKYHTLIKRQRYMTQVIEIIIFYDFEQQKLSLFSNILHDYFDTG
jgi:hypothetical protein